MLWRMTERRRAGFYSVIDHTTDGPETQAALIDAFAAIQERRVSTYPGYVSATLLASTDGTRVLNVVAWETEEDYRQFDETDDHESRMVEIAEAVDGVPGHAEPRMTGLPHYRPVRVVEPEVGGAA